MLAGLSQAMEISIETYALNITRVLALCLPSILLAMDGS